MRAFNQKPEKGNNLGLHVLANIRDQRKYDCKMLTLNASKSTTEIQNDKSGVIVLSKPIDNFC